MKSKTDRAQYVLDSSTLIALVRGEAGSETVRAAMGASVVCAVNLTETMAKLIRAGGEPRLVERYLRGLQLEIVPWDEELAWESRALCSLAWSHGICGVEETGCRRSSDPFQGKQRAMNPRAGGLPVRNRPARCGDVLRGMPVRIPAWQAKRLLHGAPQTTTADRLRRRS